MFIKTCSATSDDKSCQHFVFSDFIGLIAADCPGQQKMYEGNKMSSYSLPELENS